MTPTATIPVAIMPDAAERIAKLGLQEPINRMIEYALQHLPELDRIEVELYDRYELGDEPGLAIEAYSLRPYDPADPTERAMDWWFVTEFPPEVCWHVIMNYRQGPQHPR